MKDTAKNCKNLPSLFFFTDRHKFDDIFSVIQSLSRETAIVIREYDLEYQERLEFCKKVKNLTIKNKIMILIGKDLQLALEINANGVHFSDNDYCWSKYEIYKEYSNSDFLFTCSCHSLDSIRGAEEFGVDAVFYSPVFSVQSDPNKKPLGLEALKKATNEFQTDIYALGGIDDDNIDLLEGSGIAGIAGISIFS